MKGVLEEDSRGKYYVLQVGGAALFVFAVLWPASIFSQAHQLACGCQSHACHWSACILSATISPSHCALQLDKDVVAQLLITYEWSDW